MNSDGRAKNIKPAFHVSSCSDKRILCYGDSNTWGYIPGSGKRYPNNVRWTGVVSSILGNGFTIIENGLNGRTTIFDDYYVRFLNGKEGLGYALASQKPIDLLVLSLGTNDLRFTDARGASKGIEILLRMVHEANHSFHATESPVFTDSPNILLVSPIHLCINDDSNNTLSIQYGESFKFAEYYERIAHEFHTYYLDASKYAVPCKIDGIHMDKQSHASLGTAIARKISDIFTFPNS